MAAKKTVSKTPNTFILEIELGNDGMQTSAHIAAALTKVVKQLTNVAMAKGIIVKIMDVNGNSVGRWGYE
jgi:hypothetical protein